MTTEQELKDIKDELEFYKSLFDTHRNSAVFNLRIKTINGKKVWIDTLSVDIAFIKTLDQDDETKEWLKPVKCSR